MLALLRGQKSQAQICRERGISDDLLSRWKDIFHERAPQIFSDPTLSVAEETTRVAELERLVGQVGQQALALSI